MTGSGKVNLMQNIDFIFKPGFIKEALTPNLNSLISELTIIQITTVDGHYSISLAVLGFEKLHHNTCRCLMA